MLVKATKEVQRIPSSEGLLLAAGGEGRLTDDGQGRLVLGSKFALKTKLKTSLIDWGRRDPSRAAGAAGHDVLEPLANPRSEPGYDLNHKGMDRPSFQHLISKRAPTEEWKRRWAWRKWRGT